jgi:hypothetical protein
MLLDQPRVDTRTQGFQFFEARFHFMAVSASESVCIKGRSPFCRIILSVLRDGDKRKAKELEMEEVSMYQRNIMRHLLGRSLFLSILLLCLLGCSRPYLKQPVIRSTPRGVELLIVKKGNYPGTFGHVALRFQDEVFGYWESRSRKLVVGRFGTNDFFRYYLVYQQRDMHGFELDIVPKKAEEMRHILRDEYAQPSERRPAYGMFSNNCVVATHRILCKAFVKENEEAPPLHSSFPGGLERWTKKNFVIVQERYYASTRHLYMKMLKEAGQGTVSEHFVPLSRSDPHAYRSWRLVYTEDLRGAHVLLRPLAGVGNVITGIVQLVSSPVAAPMGKLHYLPGGLYGMTSSLPECVFLPYRRAGKTPWQPDEATRIVGSWEAERNREKQEKLLAEYDLRVEAAATGLHGEN